MDEQDYRDWMNHPVTEAFLKLLEKRKQEIYRSWANEGYTSEYENAKALGMIYVVNSILDLDYESLVGGLSD